VERSEAYSPVVLFARKGGELHHLSFGCDDMNVQIVFRKKKVRDILCRLSMTMISEVDTLHFF
jgi:hypothetical protein